MSQTSYSVDQGVAFAGMKADASETKTISRQATGVVNFGRGVCGETGNGTNVRMSGKDVITLTLDADFITANVVNGKVNGVAIAPVTFATTHAAMMTATAAAIMVAVPTCTATVTAARVITVEMNDGSTIAASDWVVTLGVSQANIAIGTAAADDVFRGIAGHEHNETGTYPSGAMVNVITEGTVWVDTSLAVAIDDTAYVLTDGTGRFTNSSSGNITTGGKFKSATAGAGLAQLSISVL